MSNYTPGPWEPRKRYYADFDLPHWEVAYGDMEAHRLVAGYVRSEANARLIAAAPEMYELIEDLYNRLLVLTDPEWADLFIRAGDLLWRIEGKEEAE